MKDIKMKGVTHTCGADGRYGALLDEGYQDERRDAYVRRRRDAAATSKQTI